MVGVFWILNLTVVVLIGFCKDEKAAHRFKKKKSKKTKIEISIKSFTKIFA